MLRRSDRRTNATGTRHGREYPTTPAARARDDGTDTKDGQDAGDFFGATSRYLGGEMRDLFLIGFALYSGYLLGRSHQRAFRQAENDRLKQDNGKLRQVLVRVIRPRTYSRN
jgi:hypothetical protein